MCVIMLANKVRPTDEMVERAFDHNKDGVGFAWRAGDEVAWKKGVMELEEAKQLCSSVPLPYVVHFRVASVGGVKPSLTHPFLIGKEGSLELEGRTKSGVLFHNGHWSCWNEKVLDAAIHSNNRIPIGPDWSDTRGMAWMIHIYGPGFMDLLPGQKGVIVTPRKFNVFTGNGWEKINDVWCSNDYFWKRYGGNHHTTYSGKLCSIGRCARKAQAGKDMCDICEREHSPKSDTESAPASGIITGVPARPLVKMLTLSEVNRLHAQSTKVISKSMLKKFTKLNRQLGKGGNREVRAKKTLTEMSAQIAERLKVGFGS